MTRQHTIQRAYARIAKHYSKAATLQQEIAMRVYERLNYLKIKPTKILDLGCGSGNCLTLLRKRYPSATIIGLDLSLTMLSHYKVPLLMRNKPQVMVADMEQLALASNSIDLIFSNQAIHWASDTHILFRELFRILKPDGVLLFSTLGPDTLHEVRRAWEKVDSYEHVNQFKDMHHLGDELLTQGFIEPVVDMEYIAVRYLNHAQLLQDLKQQGDINLHENRAKGLTGKDAFEKFKSYLSLELEKQHYLNLTYEIIYGQAWKPSKIIETNTHNNEVRIPLTAIRKHS